MVIAAAESPPATHQSTTTTTSLLQQQEQAVDAAVDYRGRAAFRSSSGGWRSAFFVIGVEVGERFAYYGASSNLINYLTGPLRQSTAAAAANVNAWSGTAWMLPLLGAFVADSFLGRYRTIVIASLIYILGLGLLTLSAVLTSLSTSHCQNTNQSTSCSPPHLQVLFFFFSLYLIALAQGGHKPCVQAFGADQFDVLDPIECKAKSSFFNWWNFGINVGMLVTILGVNYVQDLLGWGLGFGIPCIAMVLALLLFLSGTKTYRYSVKGDKKGPFLRIGLVFVAAFKNRRSSFSWIDVEGKACGNLPCQRSDQFKFLNKALLPTDGSKQEWKVICNISEVEEAKSLLRLAPVWATCLIYAIVFAQSSTFFTKQGVTMDRTITPSFTIPAASLQSFISISVIFFIPIYDRVIVPISRALTREASGITMLQRIGIGLFLSVISMVISALVETKRLKTARAFGLVDQPNVTVPMKVWWLVPQYLLFGVVDVFTLIGLQEFFYDQVPNELRSVGLSLYLSIVGIGSYLSSFLVSGIEKASGGNGRDSWFADNLNRAHLDYYYWLLAGLSAIGLVLYLYFAKSYIYNRKSIG